MRAEPAAIASAPGVQRFHPRVRGARRAAPRRPIGGQAERGGEEGQARALGERRAARAPEDRVDRVGLDAGGGERRGRGVPGEGEGVFVGRARRDLAPARPAPRGADVGGRAPAARAPRRRRPGSGRRRSGLRNCWSSIAPKRREIRRPSLASASSVDPTRPDASVDAVDPVRTRVDREGRSSGIVSIARVREAGKRGGEHDARTRTRGTARRRRRLRARRAHPAQPRPDPGLRAVRRRPASWARSPTSRVWVLIGVVGVGWLASTADRDRSFPQPHHAADRGRDRLDHARDLHDRMGRAARDRLRVQRRQPPRRRRVARRSRRHRLQRARDRVWASSRSCSASRRA